ncbi:hypothetical protein PDIG_10580 [Penicillium digitatum PHI26]|uniref:Uncharacterized protein n=3 Tax=Penicillium digitatum TaxID=36651 RepID=K9GAT3_PEND2|nr:hypothetical protein PDIP_82090 [Penicillium digitatum Pd1]EKV05610.1 hypothetical protein PDIP_82090 [Penicillium digitatum Pd1]EKV18204.1 hypothetical protein PDIG_10580 [Penicillium digitatum PHI26]
MGRLERRPSSSRLTTKNAIDPARAQSYQHKALE